MGSLESKNIKRIEDEDLSHFMQSADTTADEITRVYKIIYELNPNGSLNYEQFKQAYKAINKESFKRNERILKNIYRAFDSDQNSYVSFGEFLVSYGLCKYGSLEEKLEFTFKLYDLNMDNYITFDELNEVIKNISDFLKANPNLLKDIFAKIDKNKDDLLSKEEFVAFLLKEDEIRKLMVPFV